MTMHMRVASEATVYHLINKNDARASILAIGKFPDNSLFRHLICGNRPCVYAGASA
jgi:hypothetical protein